MEILKRILALVKPLPQTDHCRDRAAVAAIGTRLVVPYLTRSIVDDVIEGGQMPLLTGLLDRHRGADRLPGLCTTSGRTCSRT